MIKRNLTPKPVPRPKQEPPLEAAPSAKGKGAAFSKHQRLFESLKGPMMAAEPKKAVQPVLRVTAATVSYPKEPAADDTDSTPSTVTAVPDQQRTPAAVENADSAAAADDAFRFDIAETDRALEAIEHITCGQNRCQRNSF